jgi:hypothetical protein
MIYAIALYLFFSGLWYSLVVTRYTVNEQIKNGARVKTKHTELTIWGLALIQLALFPLELVAIMAERSNKK